MTLRQIELFLTLARTGSFTETAAVHYMTQPAVSQQIQSLENDIGCRLFVRSKKGVTLTNAGKTLLSEGPSLISYTDSVCKKVKQNAAEKRTVRTLCYIPPLRILPELLARFAAIRPEIMFSISRVDAMNRNTQFVFDQYDIAVGFGELEPAYEHMRFIPLYSGGFVCLVDKKHRFAERDSLKLNDLRGEMIYSVEETLHDKMLHSLNEALASVGSSLFFPTLRHFYESVTMAAAGNCISIVPAIGSVPGSCCSAIPLDYPQQYHLGIYIHENPPQDILDFCAMAEAVCREDSLPPVIV